MALSNLTLQSFLKAREGKDPHMSFKWIVESWPIFGKTRLHPTYCERMDLPLPAFQVDSKQIASTQIFLPGDSEVGQVSGTFYENDYMETVNYFLSWMLNIKNPNTGGYYPPTYYKKDVSVLLVSNRNTTSMEARLLNMWPVSMGSLSLGENDRTTVQIQFHVDAVRYIKK